MPCESYPLCWRLVGTCFVSGLSKQEEKWQIESQLLKCQDFLIRYFLYICVSFCLYICFNLQGYQAQTLQISSTITLASSTVKTCTNILYLQTYVSQLELVVKPHTALSFRSLEIICHGVKLFSKHASPMCQLKHAKLQT